MTRQLDLLIIGCSPDKLETRRRLEVKRIPVDSGRGTFLGDTAAIKRLMFSVAMRGGALQGQRRDGSWFRIYNFKTVRGVAQGCSLNTGEWFDVVAVREVL